MVHRGLCLGDKLWCTKTSRTEQPCGGSVPFGLGSLHARPGTGESVAQRLPYSCTDCTVVLGFQRQTITGESTILSADRGRHLGDIHHYQSMATSCTISCKARAVASVSTARQHSRYPQRFIEDPRLVLKYTEAIQEPNRLPRVTS